MCMIASDGKYCLARLNEPTFLAVEVEIDAIRWLYGGKPKQKKISIVALL